MDSAPDTTVSFQLSEAELERWVTHGHARLGVDFKLWNHVFSWIIVYPLAPFGAFAIEGTIWRAEVAFGYVIMLLMGITVVLRVQRVRRKTFVKWHQSTDALRFLQPTTVEISAVQITISTPRSFGSYAWSLITQIEESDSLAFVWIGDNQAIVIPARVFADERSFDSYLELAETYRRAFRGSELRCPKCRYDLRVSSSSGCPECGWRRDSVSSA